MKIAFYIASNGYWQDKVVAASCFSKYSHCEIVFSDGMCGSASGRDGGVRLKNITLDDHWDVYELLGKYDESAIRYWFDINDADTYDWLGAIGSVLHLDLTSEDKKFCSYTCAIVLGIDPIISPGSLFRLLSKEKLINV